MSTAPDERKKTLALLERGIGHVTARQAEVVRLWRSRARELQRLHSRVAAGADLGRLKDNERDLIVDPVKGL